MADQHEISAFVGDAVTVLSGSILAAALIAKRADVDTPESAAALVRAVIAAIQAPSREAAGRSS